jgi:hypothetical protein
MIKQLILLVVLLIAAPTYAYNNYQNELLDYAYKEGNKIGYGNTITGMLRQESDVGRFGKYHDNGTSFGVMCIKVGTAKDMLSGENLTDEIIKQRLIEDDYFNIRVAVLYVKYLLEYFDNDLERAILAYNVGMGRVSKFGLKFNPNNYIVNVRKRIPIGKGFGNITIKCYRYVMI